MVGILDLILLAGFVLFALIGARIGFLNMLFVAFSAYLIYLFVTLFVGDTRRLLKDSFGAISDLNDSLLNVIIAIIFCLLIVAVLGVVTRILRKLLKSFFLGWVDRLGGTIIGLAGVLVAISVFSVALTWGVYTGDEILGLVEEGTAFANTAGIEISPTTQETVDAAEIWVARVSSELTNSFIVRNIAWPTWMVVDFLFPERILGIQSGQFSQAIDALSN